MSKDHCSIEFRLHGYSGSCGRCFNVHGSHDEQVSEILKRASEIVSLLFKTNQIYAPCPNDLVRKMIVRRLGLIEIPEVKSSVLYFYNQKHTSWRLDICGHEKYDYIFVRQRSVKEIGQKCITKFVIRFVLKDASMCTITILVESGQRKNLLNEVVKKAIETMSGSVGLYDLPIIPNDLLEKLIRNNICYVEASNEEKNDLETFDYDDSDWETKFRINIKNSPFKYFIRNGGTIGTKHVLMKFSLVCKSDEKLLNFSFRCDVEDETQRYSRVVTMSCELIPQWFKEAGIKANCPIELIKKMLANTCSF